MLAHLRTASATRAEPPIRAPVARRSAAGAALLLTLAIWGCGFSGALYLPEEGPPEPVEEPAPEDTAGDNERPGPVEGGDPFAPGSP